MLRNRLSGKSARNGFDTTPIARKTLDEETLIIGERKLALYGLIISLIMIAINLLNNHYEALQKIIFERKLVSYEIITENGQVMFTNTWETAVRYSSVWLPVACGFLATYFTWMCVYLDSDVPGVHPPSPLSPQKYRVQSGHTFHLNYVFAIMVGILVSSYMFYKQVAIQY